jgi:hypothetical protein
VLAGLQAQRVRTTVPVADADLLVSAALLHDIAYVPACGRPASIPSTVRTSF